MIDRRPISALYVATIAFLCLCNVFLWGFGIGKGLAPPLALVPTAMHHGYTLYSDLIVQYFPGAMWLQYLVQFVVPDAVTALRVTMIAVSVLSTLMLFYLGRHMFNPMVGTLAAALYTLWLPLLVDVMFYFEIGVGVLTLAAVFAWQKDTATRAITAGILMGLAVLFKQQTILAALAFGGWALWRGKRVYLYGLGIIVIGGSAAAILIAQGTLEAFLYWTFDFNRSFVSIAWTSYESGVVYLWLSFWMLCILFMLLTRRNSNTTLLLAMFFSLLVFLVNSNRTLRLSAPLPFIALICAYTLAHYAARLGLFVVCGLIIIMMRFANPNMIDAVRMAPVITWFKEVTGAALQTPIWVVPAYDWYDTFYTFGGYLPPPVWMPSFEPFVEVAWEAFESAFRSNPPQYVLRFMAESIQPIVETLITSNYNLIAEYPTPDGKPLFQIWERK
jgi:hypothetical protein